MRFGRQLCGDLAAASVREWLVADGSGGYAMGTVGGLRTRRYHGIHVAPGRMLGLAALDPVLVIGDARIRLAVHEWVGGAVDPTGHLQLAGFSLQEGVPCWQWAVGDTILERELAPARDRPGMVVVHRLLRAASSVRLELAALGTRRDANGERYGNGAPSVATDAGGYVFESAYRVSGPGFVPAGEWYRDVPYREEAARGLPDREDLWHAGTFAAELRPGETLTVATWPAALDAAAPDGPATVARERARARELIRRAAAIDDVDAELVLAADRFVVAGPSVVAGYPWFGEWSRDTMTSYEGLFLETGRVDEGRDLLLRSAGTLSEGMLANTADTGALEYNTADATLWFLHAVDRHVTRAGDDDLAAALADDLVAVVDAHVAGTRYGIHVDSVDGLLVQGADGVALTWMDARVDGVPVTQRAGKAVEIDALWVNGIAAAAATLERIGREAHELRRLEARARG